MRFSQYLPVFAAVLIGALLCLAAASIGARTIEATSVQAVEKQLVMGGFEWTEVDADGLQIVLTGTAPDEPTQLAAQRAAGHAVDPARVINVMNVVQQEAIPAPKFSIEILRNDNGLSLIGLVPSSWDHDGFIEDLKSAASSGSIADFLEHADYPKPDHWDTAIDFGLEAIELLPRSKISLAADGITVTALADSKAQKASFERALAREDPDEVPVTVAITAPRPVITPFTVRFLIDDSGPHFDACAAETPAGQARILAAARALGVEDPACTLGLGSPTGQWAAAVETGMRALKDIGQGSITFADGDVHLIAGEDTTTAVFDKVVGDLEADLPPIFTLHSTLTAAKNEAEDPDSRPTFTVTRSPEGQTQIRGRMSDERSKMATEALARAAFGAQSIYSAMRIDASLPEGWSLRAMAAIEALAQLKQGSVVMTTDGLDIRGQTGDPNARATIAGILSEKLGDAQQFNINVEYVRKLDPVLNLPTPAECVARANQINATHKIVFDPGSTDLNADANETLDAIAAALKDCEDVEMEIGGHTDSQGREEMNLNLSRQRANSVLDGLLMRRVVGVKFTAEGYGESRPIADNGTEEGREANRRIEFTLIGGTEQDATAATEAEESAAVDGDDVPAQSSEAATAEAAAENVSDAVETTEETATPADNAETDNASEPVAEDVAAEEAVEMPEEAEALAEERPTLRPGTETGVEDGAATDETAQTGGTDQETAAEADTGDTAADAPAVETGDEETTE